MIFPHNYKGVSDVSHTLFGQLCIGAQPRGNALSVPAAIRFVKEQKISKPVHALFCKLSQPWPTYNLFYVSKNENHNKASFV